jgi:hypothetical protein
VARNNTSGAGHRASVDTGIHSRIAERDPPHKMRRGKKAGGGRAKSKDCIGGFAAPNFITVTVRCDVPRSAARRRRHGASREALRSLFSQDLEPMMEKDRSMREDAKTSHPSTAPHLITAD